MRALSDYCRAGVPPQTLRLNVYPRFAFSGPSTLRILRSWHIHLLLRRLGCLVGCCLKRFITMIHGILVFFAFLLMGQVAFAQNSFKGTIKNKESNQPVAGATVSVKDTEITAKSDADGKVELANIPDGEHIVEVSSPGFETKEIKITFPIGGANERVIFIAVHNELGEVTITSTTRVSREIDNVPTRIEAINEEEVDEKISMRPANVSMVLNESTGIKVQQTSATSNTQSVRIQGLDGRYTQILKDGFPAFGGFSGSLSVLDIPPLDLKQVEIIKGPSATFYGGGAIAGVVNFISKEPEQKRATSMILNQTTALGTDFSLFDSQRFRRFGYTFLGSLNYQREYDFDNDEFTELPRTRSFNLTPRVFFYLDDKTRMILGNSTSCQNREGGDVVVIRDGADTLHRYFENNNSFRNITNVEFDREFSGGSKIIAKQSIAFFSRQIETPDYLFKGRQFNSYTDVSYFHPVKGHALVFGINAVYDQFRENTHSNSLINRNETRMTFGGYVQDNFQITNRVSMEAGFRLDKLNHYGVFPLPRVSVLYRVTDNLSSRFSVGLGYKAPSIFTEEAEMLLFRNVLPIGNTLKAERSRGGTFDVNYKNKIGEKFSWSLNQMFFYTSIESPLLLTPDAGAAFRFTSADHPIRSSGFETNARIVYRLVKLFAGYTFTDAKARYLTGNQTLPLVPRGRINSALLFEREGNFKAGLEAYYTSSQFLSNRFRTEPFEVFGIFGEKTFGRLTLFINAENITDTRQGRFGPVVFPPRQYPTFSEIYTLTEGRVFNGGVKIKF
jgi:outer membrane receptor for ferrienterochelin and colicins